jgi:hypothetical protein
VQDYDRRERQRHDRHRGPDLADRLADPEHHEVAVPPQARAASAGGAASACGAARWAVAAGRAGRGLVGHRPYPRLYTAIRKFISPTACPPFAARPARVILRRDEGPGWA